MCRVTAPKVKNLVVHFRVPPSQRGKLARAGGVAAAADASRRNFYVRKLRRPSSVRGCGGSPAATARVGKPLSFIVFPCSGSVIASGVRSRLDVISALAEFAALADLGDPSRWWRKVVNSTYTGSIDCRGHFSAHLSLDSYKRRRTSERSRGGEDEVDISFRSQFFPGGLIRWRDGRGSVNLFNNGRYVLVGAREEREVRWLHRKFCALIRTYWTTMTSPTSCAWTAG